MASHLSKILLCACMILAGCASPDASQSWDVFTKEHNELRAQRDKAFVVWDRKNCEKCQ